MTIARRPWTRELTLFLGAYLLYSLGRFVAVGDVGVATDNAHAIVDLEQALSVDVEQGVQDAFDGTWALWALNHLYLAAQLIVVPGALVVLYRRSRGHYELLRNTVLATWLISLPVYALFPVAPPRLADIGLVDTITSQTGVALDSKLTTAFYNQYAAVPSLHAGFAVAVSAALAAAATRRLAGRRLGVGSDRLPGRRGHGQPLRHRHRCRHRHHGARLCPGEGGARDGRPANRRRGTRDGVGSGSRRGRTGRAGALPHSSA